MKILKFISKHEKKISRIALFAILLAVIRSIAEPFRMEYVASASPVFSQIKPFLVGALISSVGLSFMLLFFLYNWYKTVILIGVLAIILMLIVKFVYLT